METNVNMHANPHIPAFLNLFEANVKPASVQVFHDGRQLSKEAIVKGEFDISLPILVEDSPESIGMTLFRPQGDTKDKITVRHIADVVGRNFPVRVMDVEHQEELQGWTLGDLVNYFESDDRVPSKKTENLPVVPCEHGAGRKKRKAALQATSWLETTKSRPRILNQISMEYSRTPLGSKVVPPKLVRDLDWISNCWPEQQDDKTPRPSVLYYCLTSAAGCYTDFHADFGGTSVYYHVLTGSKLFVLIRPTRDNLKIYEDWLGRKDQQSTFLSDLISDPNDVVAVRLEESQTFFIPSGWVHAVYTPTDSIVLGGNFLHGFDANIQLEVDEIEHRTRVPQKFRFPYFEMIHFYAGGKLLQRLRNNSSDLSDKEKRCLPRLLLALEKWYALSTQNDESKKGHQITRAALFAAKANGCQTIDDFLQALREESEGIEKGKASESVSTECTFSKPKLSIVAMDSVRSSGGLASPKSPKIRINIKPNTDTRPNASVASCGERAQKERKDQTLRIEISSVAKELHKPMPIARGVTKRREDLDYVDFRQDDDDWVPTITNPRGGTLSKQKPGMKRKRAGACIATTVRTQVNNKGGQPISTKKPKTTTARQRLLKKFR